MPHDAVRVPQGSGYDRLAPPATPRRLSRRRFLGLLAVLGCYPTTALAASYPRVVTLFQGATDTAVALGITPVGVVESWQDKPIYFYLRDALAGVALVGLETQPSLEDIVLLNPDVIVASRFRHQRIIPLLSRIAPVVMLDDIFRYHDTLAEMALALGRQREAMRWEARLSARIEELRGRLVHHFESRWPVSVSLLDIRANEVRSYLPDSFGGSLLAALGFRWNDTQREMSGISFKLGGIESLPAVDAAVFFVMRHSRSAAIAAQLERLQAHPLWRRMAAPREDLVWEVDAVAWVLSGGVLGIWQMLDDIAHWLDSREGSSMHPTSQPLASRSDPRDRQADPGLRRLP